MSNKTGPLTQRLRKEIDDHYKEHNRPPEKLILTDSELDQLTDEWSQSPYIYFKDKGPHINTFENIPIEVRG